MFCHINNNRKHFHFAKWLNIVYMFSSVYTYGKSWWWPTDSSYFKFPSRRSNWRAKMPDSLVSTILKEMLFTLLNGIHYTYIIIIVVTLIHLILLIWRLVPYDAVRFIPHNNFTSFSPSLSIWYNLIMRGHICHQLSSHILAYKSGRAPNSIIQTIAMKFECVYYTHRAAYFIDPLTAIRKKKFIFIYLQVQRWTWILSLRSAWSAANASVSRRWRHSWRKSNNHF
jgi:hypothetical protein